MDLEKNEETIPDLMSLLQQPLPSIQTHHPLQIRTTEAPADNVLDVFRAGSMMHSVSFPCEWLQFRLEVPRPRIPIQAQQVKDFRHLKIISGILRSKLSQPEQTNPGCFRHCKERKLAKRQVQRTMDGIPTLPLIFLSREDRRDFVKPSRSILKVTTPQSRVMLRLESRATRCSGDVISLSWLSHHRWTQFQARMSCAIVKDLINQDFRVRIPGPGEESIKHIYKAIEDFATEYFTT